MTDSTEGTSSEVELGNLLGMAREQEPRTTERTLEYWRRQDFLPPVRRVGQDGLRPVWAYPPDAVDQLGALLRLREVTRDPNVLRAALWFDGYPVPTHRVRDSAIEFYEGLRAEFEKQLSKMVVVTDDNEEARWLAINELAHVLAGKRGKGFPRISRQPLEERQRGIALALGLFLGEERAMEHLESDATAVERLIGVERGRRFRPAGAKPWIDGPAAEGLAEFAKFANIDRLVELLRNATISDLEMARSISKTFVEGIATFSRIADSFVGRDNASGMAAMTVFVGDPYVGMMMPALVLSFLSDASRAEELNMVTEAIAGAVNPIRNAIADYLAQPPGGRARRDVNIEALPFPQRVAVRRLIAELGSDESHA